MKKYTLLNSLKQFSLTLTILLGISSSLNASDQAQYRAGQIVDEHSKLVCLVLAEAKFNKNKENAIHTLIPQRIGVYDTQSFSTLHDVVTRMPNDETFHDLFLALSTGFSYSNYISGQVGPIHFNIEKNEYSTIKDFLTAIAHPKSLREVLTDCLPKLR